MGFSRQEYWSGYEDPGDLPDPAIEPGSPVSADKFFTAEPPGMPTRGYPGFKAIGQSSFCCCSVAQSCLTLHDPVDCSLPGFSVHGIFQARVLEWGAIAFSEYEVLLLQLLSRCSC